FNNGSPTCCAAGESVCGGQCCVAGNGCVYDASAGTSLCCPTGATACNGSCHAAGRQCPGGLCCPAGSLTSGGLCRATGACTPAAVSCPSRSSPVSRHPCPTRRSSDPFNNGSPTCCAAGESVCGGQCCAAGNGCVYDASAGTSLCCPAGATAC